MARVNIPKTLKFYDVHGRTIPVNYLYLPQVDTVFTCDMYIIRATFLDIFQCKRLKHEIHVRCSIRLFRLFKLRYRSWSSTLFKFGIEIFHGLSPYLVWFSKSLTIICPQIQFLFITAPLKTVFFWDKIENQIHYPLFI